MLGRESAADGLENRCTGNDEIGPVAPDAAIGRASFVGHGDQVLDGVIDLGPAHPEPVDLAPVIAFEPQMQAAECRDRPRGSEQVKAGCGNGLARGFHEISQPLERFRDHGFEGGVRHVLPAIPFREGHNADGQGSPGPDALLDAARLARTGLAHPEPDEFGRAAANIEQHHTFGLPVRERSAAGRREMRLHLAREHLEFELQLLTHAGEKSCAIARDTAGFGGHEADARDAAFIDLLAADREGFERAAHRALGEVAGCRDPLPQPHDAREGVDHAETVSIRAGN